MNIFLALVVSYVRGFLPSLSLVSRLSLCPSVRLSFLSLAFPFPLSSFLAHVLARRTLSHLPRGGPSYYNDQNLWTIDAARFLYDGRFFPAATAPASPPPDVAWHGMAHPPRTARPHVITDCLPRPSPSRRTRTIHGQLASSPGGGWGLLLLTTR